MIDRSSNNSRTKNPWIPPRNPRDPNGTTPTPPPPTTPRTPDTPVSPGLIIRPNPIKPVTPQFFVLRESETNIANRLENLVNNYFQQIGGRELIGLTNQRIINSLRGNSSKINNMFAINFNYNIDNLVPVASSLQETMNGYVLKFNSYVPETGTGPGGTIVYFDNNQNLIIDVQNLAPNERVQVEILSQGDLFDGTIYERNTNDN